MSDLKTNLQQILDEKNSKIIPENIKKGIEIFGVTGTLEDSGGTGIDTSDATATVNDIINPKTAYVNGKKLVGTMIPKYASTGEVNYSDSNSITTKVSVQNSTKVLVDGYRLCLDGSNINVYNSEMQLVNSYPLSDFGIDASKAYKSLDACDYVDDTGSILVVLTCSYSEGWAGGAVTVSMLYYKNGELGIISHSDQTSKYKTFSKPSGWGHHAIACYHNANSFILSSYGQGVYKIIVSSMLSYSETKLENASSSDLNQLARSSLSDNDKYLALNLMKTEYNGRYLVDIETDTIILTQSNLSDFILVDNNYVIIGDDYYKIENDELTLIKNRITGQLNTTINNNKEPTGYVQGNYSNHLLAISNTTNGILLYTLNNIETGECNLVNSYTTSVDGNYVCIYPSIEGLTLATSSLEGKDVVPVFDNMKITSITKDGTIYMDTSDATAINNSILQDKIAYSNNEKLIGTMPNNGELNFSVSDKNQTIPKGYTSGGTIEASPILNTEYDNCLDIAYNILGQVRSKYTPIEYIQSTGTQYIDTGVKCSDTIKFQVKFSAAELTGGSFFGAINKNNERDAFRFFNAAAASSAWYLDYGSGEGYNRISGGTGKVNTIYEFEIGNRYIKNLATQTNIASKSTVSFTEKSYNFNICNLNEKLTIYYFKLYVNNELLYDLIPVKDPDGIVCLYDKLTEQYFYNSGTGDFIAGPEL